jgi:hypothetical protein
MGDRLIFFSAIRLKFHIRPAPHDRPESVDAQSLKKRWFNHLFPFVLQKHRKYVTLLAQEGIPLNQLPKRNEKS